MKKLMKFVILTIVIIVGAAIAAVIITLYNGATGNESPLINTSQVMDGDGMIYQWTSYELYGDWIEVDPYDPAHPCTMNFSKGSFIFTGSDGKETKYYYSLPDDVEADGRPEGPVYLSLENFREFENLIFSEEPQDGGSYIPVLSGTIFEYDGRGEIVISEFVRRENINQIPEGFRSSVCSSRNDVEPIPMYNLNAEP